MYKILAALFTIFFIIPFLLRGLLRFIFGHQAQQNRSSRFGKEQSNRNETSSQKQKTAKKKKVIPKNEGEYVDYEVIK